MVLPNKKKIRNLAQYKDMSDEEFEEAWEELVLDYEMSPEELERQIKEKLEELSQDYDMSDMKANDRLQIRALIMAMIQLEDLEQRAFAIRSEDHLSYENVQILDRLNKIMGGLRDDITKISNDLEFTRTIRKQSKEASVIQAIDDLREKARRFYKQRMLYIFCPECKMLLSTVWLNYSDEKNILKLKCGRCGHKFEQELISLYKTDNKNLDDVTLP